MVTAWWAFDLSAFSEKSITQKYAEGHSAAKPQPNEGPYRRIGVWAYGRGFDRLVTRSCNRIRVLWRRAFAVKAKMEKQTLPKPHGVPESFHSKFGQQFSLNGLRNRDLRDLLYPEPAQLSNAVASLPL